MSVKVMSEVWANSIATGTTLLVQLALADHAEDEKRSCYPSIGHIAKKCRVHETTARHHIHLLEKLGELRIVPNAGGSRHVHSTQRPNLYLLREYPVASDLLPPSELLPGSTDATYPPSKSHTTPLAVVLPESSVNHQLELSS